MFLRLAARDLAIVTAALALWWLTAGFSSGEGAVGDFSGLVAGLALGACAFILHEWGHLAGALAGRSVVRPAEHLRSLFVFSFDSRLNSRRQFLAMSFGGLVVTAAAVGLAYTSLPDEQLASRIARGVVLFLAFLGVFIEVPLVVWGLVGRSLPPVETFDSRRRAQRAPGEPAKPWRPRAVPPASPERPPEHATIRET